MAAKSATNAIGNHDVDYVISYKTQDGDPQQVQQQFESLLQQLVSVGLEVNVRPGERCTLLVFVKPADPNFFNQQVYKQRIKDWLYGVRCDQPDGDAQNALEKEPSTVAERLRIVYQLIRSSHEEGGAGIVPRSENWKNVDSVFALQDTEFNRNWLKKWSSQTFLKQTDLDEIRDKLGEKVAYYFAFTQAYFALLIVPAIFGFSFWVMLGSYSPICAFVNLLWCVSFTEYWRGREVDLAIRWGVKGVSQIQDRHERFQADAVKTDPLTGEQILVFPVRKRLLRQLLSIPFALLAAMALGSIEACCFAVEIFLSEVYNGPFKGALVFLPTGVLTIAIPTMTALLVKLATKLNDFENYQTTEGYNAALTSKEFVLNFITSYLPVFLTAFVYVPFGSLIVPYLDVFSLTAQAFATDDKPLEMPSSSTFEINPARLRQQVIYFTVTAQIVNFGLEAVLPYIKQRGMRKYESFISERASKHGGGSIQQKDAPEEAEFLARVREEASREAYDVTEDLREMVVQFGYLALFGVVWPLVPVSFVINNWIELRSDALKIAVEMRRPDPLRADSIGPWLQSLSFLTWLGSLTGAALVYMFRNDGLGPDGTPTSIQPWALLLCIALSEHLYLLVQWAVRLVVQRFDTPMRARDRGERFLVRKRYLEDKFGADFQAPATSPVTQTAPPDLSRASLEDEARAATRSGHATDDRFWGRQRGWRETYRVGSAWIAEMAPKQRGEGKKEL